MSKTKYVILEQQEGQSENDIVWQICADGIEASSPNAALRLALEGNGHHGRYVAVPSRSWNPKPVKVETKHQLRIG